MHSGQAVRLQKRPCGVGRGGFRDAAVPLDGVGLDRQLGVVSVGQAIQHIQRDGFLHLNNVILDDLEHLVVAGHVHRTVVHAVVAFQGQPAIRHGVFEEVGEVPGLRHLHEEPAVHAAREDSDDGILVDVLTEVHVILVGIGILVDIQVGIGFFQVNTDVTVSEGIFHTLGAIQEGQGTTC